MKFTKEIVIFLLVYGLVSCSPESISDLSAANEASNGTSKTDEEDDSFQSGQSSTQINGASLLSFSCANNTVGAFSTSQCQLVDDTNQVVTELESGYSIAWSDPSVDSNQKVSLIHLNVCSLSSNELRQNCQFATPLTDIDITYSAEIKEGNKVITSLGSTELTPSIANTSLAMGASHTCALFSDGRIKCWGNNGNGQLGYGDATNRGDSPNTMGSNLDYVDLGTGRAVKMLALGDDYSCAVLDNSKLKCWGSGTNGAIGYGSTTKLGDQTGEMGDSLPYVDLGTGRTTKSVSAQGCTTCAILDNDKVKCWGGNGAGQLGLGHTNPLGNGAGEMGDNLDYVDLGTGRTALQISVGSSTVCAILDNEDVKCWGENDSGQLGQGPVGNLGDESNEMGDNLPAIDLGTGRKALRVAVGINTSCAVLQNGNLVCWGGNATGELGIGNMNNIGDDAGEMGDNLVLTDLGTGIQAYKVAIGGSHSCALSKIGEVKCWGYNGFGQLGLENITSIGDGANEMGDNLVATNLGTGAKAVDIFISSGSTCAILSDFTFKCWGINDSGNLGYEHSNYIGNDSEEMGDSLPTIELE